ncbi:EamA-like transporter family protein [Acinetobacter calcoaceticus]|uniref:EamA-like transporter family protein n=1 Tax=Acinetobacter calcoaceticus TaxID=471 RepID=A0A4R1Y4I2_ACICA|nr:EamA-like transporter family protein [Acinetobacter calcoaceticus]
MHLIFAAALCSVLVSILLKRYKSQGLDVLQIITWNYVVASLLCFIWFKPDLAHISVSTTPWWIIILLAMLLPSIFLCLGKSLQSAGIVKTEIAQRLSVVLSVLAAYLFFQEQFSSLKILGLVLGLAAVCCLILPQAVSADQAIATHPAKQGNSFIASGNGYLLAVWCGYAMVDILLKYTSSLGLQFAVTLNLSFILALLFSLILVLLRKTQWNIQAMWAGLMIGAFNFANIALYVKAHQWLKDSPAVVFAGMNILVVLLGAIAGVVIFKEYFGKKLILSLLLGLAGVLCLAFSL